MHVFVLLTFRGQAFVHTFGLKYIAELLESTTTTKRAAIVKGYCQKHFIMLPQAPERISRFAVSNCSSVLTIVIMLCGVKYCLKAKGALVLIAIKKKCI